MKFGPAGLGSPPVRGLKLYKSLGLSCCEIAFTYGVYMSNSAAREVGAIAGKLGIELSAHAPYYINLASVDAVKKKASVKRILDSCERVHHLGGGYVVFHPAYYGKLEKGECYDIVKECIVFMQKIIGEKKWKAVLCPETTGRKSQFGELDELLRLNSETGCGICVDFAHIHAREGKVDYDSVCRKIKGVKKLTCHFSGIEFGARGERRHLRTPEAELKKLLLALKNNKMNVRLINESPDPVADSVLAKRLWGGA